MYCTWCRVVVSPNFNLHLSTAKPNHRYRYKETTFLLVTTLNLQCKTFPINRYTVKIHARILQSKSERDIKLTENQEPWSLVKRTAEDTLAFSKSSKAEDEYPRQYPKLSGPRAAMKVARIALPILSFPEILSDWTELEGGLYSLSSSETTILINFKMLQSCKELLQNLQVCEIKPTTFPDIVTWEGESTASQPRAKVT